MLCLLLLLGLSNVGVAAELEIVSFGWQGHFQPGRWTPLWVKTTDLKTDTPTFDVTAKDAEGNLMTLRQVGLPVGEPGTFELRVKSGRVESEIEVSLVEGDDVVATSVHRTMTAENLDTAFRLNDRVIGILSGNVEFGEKLAADFLEIELPENQYAKVILFDDGDALPVDPVNWESLDVLFLSIDQKLPKRQSEALRQWIREGGHLLLSIGAQAEAYQESSLADWLPLELGDPLKLRDLSQFESFIGRSSRIEFTGRVEGTELSSFLGESLLDSLDGTLVVAMPYGFGKVTVSGVDLDRAPMSNWKAISRLIEKLTLSQNQSNDRESTSDSNQLTDSGISELATQLSLAQQDFPEVRRSSIWVVISAIAVYLLLIGPLDYLLVYRVFKRPELTWVTFPLLMLGMAVVSVWAGRSTNSLETTINQVNLIDVDGTQQIAKVKSLMTGYSPASQRVAIEAEMLLDQWSEDDNVEADAAILSWDSVPEDGFGGIYRQSGFESLSATKYHLDRSKTKIADLPVAQWSTVSLTVDQFVRGIPLIRSDLKGSTLGSVSGTVEHRLPGELVEWMLIYRNRVYFPRPTRRNEAGVSIPANQPIELTRSDLSVSRDLKGYLTGTRQIRVKSDKPTEETRIVVEQEDYDLFSTDPKAIMRILSFHSAAGGSRYTNLENSALHRVDWSEKLDSRHAVLYGVLKADEQDDESQVSPVRWLWNGESVRQDRQTTIVRCLLPVELQNDTRRVLPDLNERLKNYKR
ncbi:MAG: hypothetical protein P8M30_06865 [Planctomycetaceae bacterium]|nr:hypothetical protein [Planctomycetaceae bacterium]